MPTDEKIQKRIKQLLALAAPSSGTTEHERASAALEAAKLIAEHGLVVGEAPPPPERKRRPRPAPSPPTRPIYKRPEYTWQRHDFSGYYPPPIGSNWKEVSVGQTCTCVACGCPIFAGDTAWFDSSFGPRFRCYDITCNELI